MREQREKEFDEYVTQLKEISKSNKNSAYPFHSRPIWRRSVISRQEGLADANYSLDSTEGI